MRFELLLAALPFALAAPTISPRAPLIVPRNGSPIPGKFIVKFKNDALNDIFERAVGFLKNGAEHKFEFGNFKGFSAEIDDSIVDLLRLLPGVEWIEQDAVIKASFNIEKRAYVTQSSATWGLGRLSSVNRGSSTYKYDDTAGAGTCAYIIDTGIFTTHPDFEGRATHLANYAGDGTTRDGNGHGTHVAGTIGSKTWGVAKKTKLYAVKVLGVDGSGTNSGVIAGINFAAQDSQSRAGCKGKSVGNLSLGGSKSTAVNTAARNAVTAGLFLAVAAGNEKEDAANSSPASEPTAFTVGATDSSDRISTFSNFGSVVDIFAPGTSITSTWIDGKTNTISGTSMASPHIAGLAAYLIALENLSGPTAIGNRIKALGSKSKITGVPTGTVNLLAYNGAPA
ncbi:peptidase S8/S53 domain-containing protein [Dendryphion nanum]|uniref:Peptidase S8/S53 domain-containing protein n=1 Tax=Dendryphion nanum TaxID=256645 RepID=A0A9P9IYL8_9PLEO|nr:peptidase S8/S53 domain-containing protein [Dendryphion nanum]